MKKLIASAAVVLLAAGAAYADPAAGPMIGAQITGASSGIGNNATTVYHGASITDSHESAVNSASNTQAGFLNTFVAAQAGEQATANAPEVSVDASLLQATVNAPAQSQHNSDNYHNEDTKPNTPAAGGTVNMSGMFQLLNTTNSIGG